MLIKRFSNQRGFTLLEVMIAIAILAIGMLGIAGLHMISIEHNHAAYLRSQAVIITQDIVERMRSNPEAIKGNFFNDIDTDNIATLPSINCLTDALGCDHEQLAQIDIAQWAQSIKTINNDNTREQLPEARATIKLEGTTSNAFTVKIEWRVKKLTKGTGDNTFYERTKSKSNYEFQVIIH